MPRLTNKKLAARAVVTVVKKAKRKTMQKVHIDRAQPATNRLQIGGQPDDAKLDAAFKRATSV